MLGAGCWVIDAECTIYPLQYMSNHGMTWKYDDRVALTEWTLNLAFFFHLTLVQPILRGHSSFHYPS